jgi:hypothetical protein
MFTSNPFAELSAFISPAVMQTYVVVMIILVAAGTIYDVLHKKSARYASRCPATAARPTAGTSRKRPCTTTSTKGRYC